MTDPQYWHDRKWNKPVGISSEIHKDEPARTKYGQTTPAHHSIRFTDNTEGTTLLVKIFEDRTVLSMNGPMTLRDSDLQRIYGMAMACRDYGCKEIRPRNSTASGQNLNLDPPAFGR